MGAARYDDVADLYTSTPDTRGGNVAVALFELAGNVEGRRVLDLACGHGRISRELRRRGALVLGIDVSSKLLEWARADEQRHPLGLDYLLGDVTKDDVLTDEHFDGVTCHFALSDVDDLDGALTTVARVLVDGGWFVFSILHPCFPGGGEVSGSWGASYHEEGFWRADGALSVLRRRVGANHRMLSTYLNALGDHGLLLDRVLEPLPDDDWLAERAEARGLPVYLVARARKA